ncbi:MAG TPA: aldehyde ferredoxin oxidoreductase N-terminal domain-containing protein, partial [Candidatus Acidoferrum sp.]|nr:aldehyde ferredoxin oxidoreductase N-terminal domain-containing protein [Candidatus Acidoferrum sp.]
MRKQVSLMPFGTPGKILYIDLTRSTTWVEPISESLYRQYPGGKALAAYLLLKENPPQADPFGPEN